ncbi:HemK methyltransferase member 2 [Geranomyces variabilis]|uniref:HemK methyltransferase member 2 n=1 Tax=Geranomyces variabilis TaxID=109894 RepID=A0AAD5XPL9_9FUNG|nr:HemK methyltransferase member 2 [Geranomyces variabilis]
MAQTNAAASEPTQHPTPDLSHLKHVDYRNIYEPAEDTFLFLDTLQKEREYINNLDPVICLEIGSGSGCVSVFLASLLAPYHALFLTTDINPAANRATLQTATANRIAIDALRADLLPALRSRIDALLFNPPYVPTPSAEVGSHSIVAAWAGGIDGREVIDRLLPLVSDALSERGVFYMVVVNENRPEELREVMNGFAFDMEVVMGKRAGNERLKILRLSRML